VKRRIFVASPLRADGAHGLYAIMQTMSHLDYMRDCVARVLDDGNAPFAPHGFYTYWLNDDVPADREAGIRAGSAWLLAAHEVHVFTDMGISEGMRAEIALAESEGIPVVMRTL